MSLFPRYHSNHHPSGSPFWRLLEDPFFVPTTPSGSGRQSVFQPKFDVHETPDSFVLEGELAGITDKNALDIHFSDQQTLVIHGRVERTHMSGPDDKPNEAPTSPRKPTVEDAPEEPEHSKSADESQLATTTGQKSVAKASSSHRIWVQERSVGEFQRAFNFPAGIDQDKVKAALKDGILTITVPKIVQKGKRRIDVE